MKLRPAATDDLVLGRREVHLWYTPLVEELEPARWSAYRALLSADEREQQDRYHFERHRLQYLISHALVRTVLSRYAPVEPEAWRFKENEYGRPDVIIPPGAPPLRHNLSHTDGLAVCAVTLERDVGVDVEDLQRRGKTVELADQFFAPPEMASLRALPRACRRARFFDYWTLKEAYMKAVGVGLSLGLENFAFRFERSGAIDIAFTEAIADEPGEWQFHLLNPTSRHRSAMATRRGKGDDLGVVSRWVLPLAEERPLEGIGTTPTFGPTPTAEA